MKKCTICGKIMPDAAEFCDACFGPLVMAEVPADEPVSAPTGVPASDAESAFTPAPAPKKKLPNLLAMSKWMKITLASVAVVGVVAVVGLLTNWFGLVSPLNKLGKAVMKTVSADSLTITCSGKRTTSYGDVYREKGTYKVVLDKEKEKLTILMENDEYTSLYDKGTTYYYSEPEGDYRGYASIYEDDDDEVSDTVFDIYNDVYDGKKIHWDEVVKAFDLDDYVDDDEIDEFVKTVYKECLNNREWLEECLDYDKKGNTYTFKPDVEELGESIIDLVDDSDAFKRKAKRGIEDEIDWYIEAAEDADADITITITLKRGYLSNIHVEYSDSYDNELELDIDITDVNKTVIDTKKIKNEVEDLLEENACHECGEEYGQYEDDGVYLCWECYYVCDVCGEYGYEERDGKRYCWEHDEVCDNCGDFCNYTYDFDYEDWCYDCYYTCEECGDYASYTYRGKRLCYDCYYDY